MRTLEYTETQIGDQTGPYGDFNLSAKKLKQRKIQRETSARVNVLLLPRFSPH